jgi:protein-L-isoaspartate(D-aspartate) O-methyltransferase
MEKKQNNDSLVDNLISQEVLSNKPLIDAFRKIDRQDFVLLNEEEIYDIEKSLKIGYGQTISEPMVVAFMLELLDIKETNKVLDIGSGSAYTTALISQMVGKFGYVFGLEVIPTLVNFGKENLKKYEIYNAFISKASYDLGIKRKKFDRILVSAAAQQMPMELLEQLEENGKMVIPIKKSIYLIEKKEGKYFENRIADFDFDFLVEN